PPPRRPRRQRARPNQLARQPTRPRRPRKTPARRPRPTATRNPAKRTAPSAQLSKGRPGSKHSKGGARLRPFSLSSVTLARPDRALRRSGGARLDPGRQVAHELEVEVGARRQQNAFRIERADAHVR